VVHSLDRHVTASSAAFAAILLGVFNASRARRHVCIWENGLTAASQGP
jgi:hypothetical protein